MCCKFKPNQQEKNKNLFEEFQTEAEEGELLKGSLFFMEIYNYLKQKNFGKLL